MKLFYVEKIISGGQTGADRGALDFAINHEIEHGGWCPKGRRAEDGTIPEIYNLQEAHDSNYLVRTQRNVNYSNATIVFGYSSAGSCSTVRYCKQVNKPVLWLEPICTRSNILKVCAFLDNACIQTLNVAGNRASKCPAAYQATYDTLMFAKSVWHELPPDEFIKCWDPNRSLG